MNRSEKKRALQKGPSELKDLHSIYQELDGALSHKWRHYFEVYERYFSRFRGQPVKVLEIGVQDGGSLHMWRKFFGDQATIIGVDISPHSKKLEAEGFQIEIGNQGDLAFLEALKLKVGEVDIIVDDGSHRPNHQILALNELFPILSEGGFFLCEDVYNSYLYKAGSFIDYTKGLIDELHGWWDSDLVGQNTFPTALTKTCGGIYFHDGIVVLEKCQQEERYDLISGDFSLAPPKGKPPPEGPYLTQELLASLPTNLDGTTSFHQSPIPDKEKRPLEDYPVIGALASRMAPHHLQTPTRNASAWTICWGEAFQIVEQGLLVDGFIRSLNYFPAEIGQRYKCEVYLRAYTNPSNGLPLTYYAGPIALGRDGKMIQRVARHKEIVVGDGIVRVENTLIAGPEAAKIYVGLQGPTGEQRADALPCFELVSFTRVMDDEPVQT